MTEQCEILGSRPEKADREPPDGRERVQPSATRTLSIFKVFSRDMVPLPPLRRERDAEYGDTGDRVARAPRARTAVDTLEHTLDRSTRLSGWAGC